MSITVFPHNVVTQHHRVLQGEGHISRVRVDVVGKYVTR